MSVWEITATNNGVSDTDRVTVTVEALVLVAPSVPQNVIFTTDNKNDIDGAKWDAPLTGSPPITYRVEWGFNDKDGVFQGYTGNTMTSTTSINFSGGVDGARVRAQNSVGNSGWVHPGLVSPTRVTANAGSDGTVVTGGTIRLGGTDRVINGVGATTILWTHISGTSGVLSSTSVARPTLTAPTVTANETLVYRKRVTNNGVSDTDDVSIDVQAIAPSVPQNVIFTTDNKNDIDGAKWDAPLTGSPPITYRYQSGSNDKDGVFNGYGNEFTTTLTSATTGAGGFAHFRVRAENAAGVSDWVEIRT